MTTIGRPWIAHWTVAVPEAVIATSAPASTASVGSRTVTSGRPQSSGRLPQRHRAGCPAGAAPAPPRTGPRAARAASSGMAAGQHRHVPRQLVLPAAGQERHRRRGGATSPSSCQERLRDRTGHRHRGHLHQRVADELHRHAGAPVDRLLERERSPAPWRRRRRIVAHAAGAPGPQLRADVVDHRHAQLRCSARHQAEVEVGKIDGDEDVGTAAAPLRRSASAAAASERGTTRSGFGEAGDGEAAVVRHERRRRSRPGARRPGRRSRRPARVRAARSRARRRTGRPTARRTTSSRACGDYQRTQRLPRPRRGAVASQARRTSESRFADRDDLEVGEARPRAAAARTPWRCPPARSTAGPGAM